MSSARTPQRPRSSMASERPVRARLRITDPGLEARARRALAMAPGGVIALDRNIARAGSGGVVLVSDDPGAVALAAPGAGKAAPVILLADRVRCGVSGGKAAESVPVTTLAPAQVEQQLADAVVVVSEGLFLLPPGLRKPSLARWWHALCEARSLTANERRILGQVAQGKTNQQAAEALGVSPDKIKAGIRSIMRHLGLRNRTEAAVFVASVATSGAQGNGSCVFNGGRDAFLQAGRGNDH